MVFYFQGVLFQCHASVAYMWSNTIFRTHVSNNKIHLKLTFSQNFNYSSINLRKRNFIWYAQHCINFITNISLVHHLVITAYMHTSWFLSIWTDSPSQMIQAHCFKMWMFPFIWCHLAKPSNVFNRGLFNLILDPFVNKSPLQIQINITQYPSIF